MEYFKNIKPRERVIVKDDDLGSMYLEDTEVLTKDGFKKMLDLKEGDSILTRYCDSNITEWEEVSTLVEDYFNQGTHSLTWDGIHLSSGQYLVKMESGSFSKTQIISLIK